MKFYLFFKVVSFKPQITREKKHNQVVENWRDVVPLCDAKKCASGRIYRDRIDPCNASCERIRNNIVPCLSVPVEGCSCPEGQTAGFDGNCIDIDECVAGTK